MIGDYLIIAAMIVDYLIIATMITDRTTTMVLKIKNIDRKFKFSDRLDFKIAPPDANHGI